MNIYKKDNLKGVVFDIGLVTFILILAMVPAWPCWKKNMLKFKDIPKSDKKK